MTWVQNHPGPKGEQKIFPGDRTDLLGQMRPNRSQKKTENGQWD